MSILDISAEYRKQLIKFLNQGEFDNFPEFKRLALNHLMNWQEWVDATENLLTYGPWRIILLFPLFMIQNAKVGRAFSHLMRSQEKLTEWGKRNPNVSKEIEYRKMLMALTGKTPIQ